MPMHAWSGKGASRLTGTTMVTAPGLQLRKWTPGRAQEYLWCPLTIRVTATLLDSVTLDHSTTMTRLICTIIKFSVRLFSNLYIYLSPARYLSERHRQDSSQAQPTKVHICWSPPVLSVTRWHCTVLYSVSMMTLYLVSMMTLYLVSSIYDDTVTSIRGCFLII